MTRLDIAAANMLSMTRICHQLMDDAIDAIEIDAVDFAERRIKHTYLHLNRFMDLDPRSTQVIERVMDYLWFEDGIIDSHNIRDIRQAQKLLVQIDSIAHTIYLETLK